MSITTYPGRSAELRYRSSDPLAVATPTATSLDATSGSTPPSSKYPQTEEGTPPDQVYYARALLGPTYPPGAALPTLDRYDHHGDLEAVRAPQGAVTLPPDVVVDINDKEDDPTHSPLPSSGNSSGGIPATLHRPNPDETWDLWFEQRNRGVKRDLAQSYLTMIAISAALGTGIFFKSGVALRNGGPVGLLLSYVIMATVVGSVMTALSEMCTRYPLTSSITHYAARFVDEAAGFAMGVTYWWAYAISVPTEICAAAIVVQYWDHTTDPAVYISVFIVVTLVINLLGVQRFGQVNFWLSLPKVLALLVLILLGLVLALGGGSKSNPTSNDCLAFRCWSQPGAFATLDGIAGAKGGFLGFWATMAPAAYSYQGMEIISLAAGETSNPRGAMPSAVKRSLAWIVLLYIAAAIVIGWTVPFTDPALLKDKSNALNMTQSPFVIAIRSAGIHALDSVVNAIILLSALTTSSVDLYSSSRSLKGLANEILLWADERPSFHTESDHGPIEKAARRLDHCRSDGLPLGALIATSCFMPLAYAMRAGGVRGTTVAYLRFSTVTTLAALSCWWIILVTYLCFYQACHSQREDRRKFRYAAPFQPWLTLWGIAWITLVLITNGFSIFIYSQWDTGDFIASYIAFPMTAITYCLWKWRRRTKLRRPSDIDVRADAEATDASQVASAIPPWQMWQWWVERVF